MNEELAIRVESVSKAFKLPHEKVSTLKGVVIGFFRRKRTFEIQQVLDDVSLEIKKGEFFGIVGRNGSGKSTLLKLLAGIYYPNAGDIEIKGKLTPFIELGVGFNPELTGRENVYLNGALLGFSTKQMDELYDGIVEFAELEAFMDQKLKNYSSGMQVRLAFSIAIRAKSDILLIDEVLAVGDEAFQRKCLDVFEKYKATKQTIILVTHDMDTVRKFCSRAMLLNNGEIVMIGNPRSVASKYSQLNQETIDRDVARSNSVAAGKHHLSAKVLDGSLKAKESFEVGQTMVAEIGWKGLAAEKIESIGVNIFKLSGEHITGVNTRYSPLVNDWKKRGKIELEFKLNLTPGKYYLLVEAFEKEGRTIDALLAGPQFAVTGEVKWSGLVDLPHKWRSSNGSQK